jgi:hypothetical protein
MQPVPAHHKISAKAIAQRMLLIVLELALNADSLALDN